LIGRCLWKLQDRHDGSASADAFSAALGEFYRRALDLADGQLASLEQRLVDDDHDWGWYKDVMDKKLVNVLLSPFSLLVNPSSKVDPAEAVRQCFLLLNGTFFHRQVLDDLMDFEEDLSNGTANSLIYMLVSQGRIAAAATDCDAETNEDAILAELRRSWIPSRELGLERSLALAHERDSARKSPAGSARDVLAIARAALANDAADRSIPLAELSLKCIRRKDALLHAWASGERASVREIVERSGIAIRILDSIASGRDHAETEQALAQLDDVDVREIVYLFYVRTLRTYERCVGKWRHRGGEPATAAPPMGCDDARE
jgi:hypothetical protein